VTGPISGRISGESRPSRAGFATHRSSVESDVVADLSGLRFVEVVLVDLQAYVWTAQWSTGVLRLDDDQNAALVEGIMPGAVRLEAADSQDRPSRRGVRWAVSVDAYRFDGGRRWLGGWWRQRVLRREDDPPPRVVGFAGPGNGWGLRVRHSAVPLGVLYATRR
jgi:hypothetical protein